MILADGAAGALLTLLWVFCIFDAIVADEARVRNLPKWAWILLVIVLLDVGAILWLVAGRPSRRLAAPPATTRTVPPEYDRPGRATAANPDDDAAFLEGLKRRAEEQRRRATEDGTS